MSKRTEHNQERYNEIYSYGGNNKEYLKHFTDSIYYPMWLKAVEIILTKTDPHILDVGCGVGQFIRLLKEKEIRYKGIDFSEKAVEMANDPLVTLDNVYTTKEFDNHYDWVCLFEVLEHIEGDIEVLKKVKGDILFSVPNFDSETHVRFFRDPWDVILRYEKVIDIKKIYTFNINKSKLFLAHGYSSTTNMEQ